MPKSINELIICPVYSSAAAYQQATGKQARVFKAGDRPQYWALPAVDLSNPFSDVIPYNSLAVDKKTGKVLLGADGHPFIVQYLISAENAAYPSIPDPHGNAAAGVPIPPPLRDLAPDEYLETDPLQGGEYHVVVRNKSEDLNRPTAFTNRHAQILEALAQKAGV